MSYLDQMFTSLTFNLWVAMWHIYDVIICNERNKCEYFITSLYLHDKIQNKPGIRFSPCSSYIFFRWKNKWRNNECQRLIKIDNTLYSNSVQKSQFIFFDKMIQTQTFKINYNLLIIIRLQFNHYFIVTNQIFSH